MGHGSGGKGQVDGWGKGVVWTFTPFLLPSSSRKRGWGMGEMASPPDKGNLGGLAFRER